MVETRRETGRRTLAELINEHRAAQRAAISVVKEWNARRFFQSRLVPSLTTLISTHKAYVARMSEQAGSALELEMKARSRILTYQPRDRREALKRLGYLFAVVATANNWLDDDEMQGLLEMIRKY